MKQRNRRSGRTPEGSGGGRGLARGALIAGLVCVLAVASPAQSPGQPSAATPPDAPPADAGKGHARLMPYDEALASMREQDARRPVVTPLILPGAAAGRPTSR